MAGQLFLQKMDVKYIRLRCQASQVHWFLLIHSLCLAFLQNYHLITLHAQQVLDPLHHREFLMKINHNYLYLDGLVTPMFVLEHQ